MLLHVQQTQRGKGVGVCEWPIWPSTGAAAHPVNNRCYNCLARALIGIHVDQARLTFNKRTRDVLGATGPVMTQRRH